MKRWRVPTVTIVEAESAEKAAELVQRHLCGDTFIAKLPPDAPPMEVEIVDAEIDAEPESEAGPDYDPSDDLPTARECDLAARAWAGDRF